MSTHSALFERAVVYPSTNFPGRTQENLLGQLLRKKLEPGVEAWVDEGLACQAGNEGGGGGEGEVGCEGEIDEKWRDAKELIGERVARAAVKHRMDQYTAEEREMGIENVNTGLMRQMKLGGADRENEGGEDEEMRDGDEEGGKEREAAEETTFCGPVRSLDEIVRFMTVGKAPEDEPLSVGFGVRR